MGNIFNKLTRNQKKIATVAWLQNYRHPQAFYDWADSIVANEHHILSLESVKEWFDKMVETNGEPVFDETTLVFWDASGDEEESS
jgi:hypothetical protein